MSNRGSYIQKSRRKNKYGLRQFAMLIGITPAQLCSLERDPTVIASGKYQGIKGTFPEGTR